jgi:hypothetical protein
MNSKILEEETKDMRRESMGGDDGSNRECHPKRQSLKEKTRLSPKRAEKLPENLND